MVTQGDDLSHPRNIEFTVVFPDENTALQFADHFRALGLAVSVERSGTAQDFPWDVIVVKNMVPSYEGIGAFEVSLQQAAETLGGHNDGWGMFSEHRKN